VRSFNRTVTQRIGALSNQFLGRRRSLGASRVLFEIGIEGIEIRELRERLALDSGYTSRLLRVLEREGLIRVDTSKNDSRARVVVLTASGRRELSTLNRLSDQEAASILEPLNEKQRALLAASMETVERLLTASSVVITVEDPSSRVSGECLSRYYRELAERFDAGFDPAASIPAVPGDLTPPRGYFLVARLHGKAVGCGALKCHPDFGEIKRMWVAPEARGLGIARRLLSRLEAIARKRKLPVLRLETNKSLTEAQALYRNSGYREVPRFNDERYAHHWFEKRLTGE
jgi:DNA-binding MarR family transcriptional regulator/GNAT superfamily N-acetyltransferase